MLLPYRDEKTQRRRWLIGAIAIAGIGAALTGLPLGNGLAKWSYDLPYVARGPVLDTNVVVLLEDRDALESLGQKGWPPARTVHARLVDRLREEGAQLVVFDILFLTEHSGEDEEFAAAIKRHGNVILGASHEVLENQVGNQAGARVEELKLPTAGLRTNAAAWGLLLVGNLDARFGVRRMIVARKENPGVAWVAAQRTGRLGANKSPEQERWVNFYGPSPALDSITFRQLLQTNLAPGFLRGKIVFVGRNPTVVRKPPQDDVVVTARQLDDVFATPFTELGHLVLRGHDFAPGAEVLANACANLMRGDWLRRMPTPLQSLIAALFGIAALALLIGMGRRWALMGAAVLLAALLLVVVVLQWHMGLWWNWLALAAIQLPLATAFSFACPRLPRLAFISYRRDRGDKFAVAIRSELRARGYDVFLDVAGLTAGEFPEQLRREIERSPNFVLVLSPGALDERINRQDDWLAHEISHAFARGKKVIPILIDGFSFDSAAPLHPSLARLPRCQSITHHHDKWDTTIDTLQKFLLARARRAKAQPRPIDA